MYTMVYSSLLLLILTIATISIMCGTKLEAEGLPIYRRERGTNEDVLSGADFLSVLMRSSNYQSYTEVSTPSTTIKPVTLQSTTTKSNEVYVRHSRSTSYLPTISQPENPEFTSIAYRGAPLQDIEFDTTAESIGPSSTDSDNVIVAVRVSTSVAKRKGVESEENSDKLDIRTSSTTYPNDIITSSTIVYDQKAIASEERPSIVAEVSNSELSIDEGEPITTDTDLTAAEYPANVRPLPRPASFNNDKLQPLHETLIYHDSPRDPNRARSVSYSAVIQAVAHDQGEKNPWRDETDQNLDRRERHYEGAQPSNNAFADGEIRRRSNFTRSSPSAAETNHFYVTSNPDNEQSLEKSWEEPKVYAQEITTAKTTETSERNWEISEKAYTPPQSRLPPVYAQAEQNYEVDESVSVISNGRVHGVQPQNPNDPKQEESKTTQSSKKTDDNQKVGYVVEGRNYRKYRVEERTSDGFIVGEYGVVSHDDGSLRGVRYTADGTINPRLIYDALMKFLSL